jgi:hypothetical protein
MAIQVRNSAEFKRLVEALVLELVDANIAFNMHMNLIEAHVQDRTRAMQEIWTFWSLTIQGTTSATTSPAFLCEGTAMPHFEMERVNVVDGRQLGLAPI